MALNTLASIVHHVAMPCSKMITQGFFENKAFHLSHLTNLVLVTYITLPDFLLGCPTYFDLSVRNTTQSAITYILLLAAGEAAKNTKYLQSHHYKYYSIPF